MNHYEGVELSKERIFVYAKKNPALQEFISAISKRFSEFCDEPAGVVTATRIADMKAWPISWDALKDFGDKELQLLLNHFKTPLLAAGISIEEAEIEWTPLKKKWFLKVI